MILLVVVRAKIGDVAGKYVVAEVGLKAATIFVTPEVAGFQVQLADPAEITRTKQPGIFLPLNVSEIVPVGVGVAVTNMLIIIETCFGLLLPPPCKEREIQRLESWLKNYLLLPVR